MDYYWAFQPFVLLLDLSPLHDQGEEGLAPLLLVPTARMPVAKTPI